MNDAFMKMAERMAEKLREAQNAAACTPNEIRALHGLLPFPAGVIELGPEFANFSDPEIDRLIAKFHARYRGHQQGLQTIRWQPGAASCRQDGRLPFWWTFFLWLVLIAGLLDILFW